MSEVRGYGEFLHFTCRVATVTDAIFEMSTIWKTSLCKKNTDSLKNQPLPSYNNIVYKAEKLNSLIATNNTS